MAPIPEPIRDVEESTVLDEESRRALSIYRAIHMVDDPSGADALLNLTQTKPQHVSDEKIVLSKRDCRALAKIMRKRGYPLDDDGIRRFKKERGYSQVVRIGPELASAYANFAKGLEARLIVSPDEVAAQDSKVARALKLLSRIGRRPKALLDVRRVIGVTDTETAEDGIIPIGVATAEALLAWTQRFGFSLGKNDLERIRRAAGLSRRTIDQAFADFITHVITAKNDPPDDYRMLTSPAGHTVNRRTYAMLSRAEKALQGKIRLFVIRGSHVTGASLGAHPHKGGGVVDLSLQPSDEVSVEKAIVALRRAGFAAWYRNRRTPHIHAVAIGDKDLAPAALWQIKSYVRGRDGRSRSQRDPHHGLGVRPAGWSLKYRIKHA